METPISPFALTRFPRAWTRARDWGGAGGWPGGWPGQMGLRVSRRCSGCWEGVWERDRVPVAGVGHLGRHLRSQEGMQGSSAVERVNHCRLETGRPGHEWTPPDSRPMGRPHFGHSGAPGRARCGSLSPVPSTSPLPLLPLCSWRCKNTGGTWGSGLGQG